MAWWRRAQKTARSLVPDPMEVDGVLMEGTGSSTKGEMSAVLSRYARCRWCLKSLLYIIFKFYTLRPKSSRVTLYQSIYFGV